MISGDNYELELYKNYCVICLNTENAQFVLSKCCYNNIHVECLIDWMLHSSNDNVLCPICRCSISNTINFMIFVDYLSEKDNICKKKALRIINNLYSKEWIVQLLKSNNTNYRDVRDVSDDSDNNDINNNRNNRGSRIYNCFISCVYELYQRVVLLWFIFLIMFFVILFFSSNN